MEAHQTEMLVLCQRHIIAITKGTKPKVVELEFYKEAPEKLVTYYVRTPQDTVATYGNRHICTSLVKVDKKEQKKTGKEWKVNPESKMKILQWDLNHEERLEKDRIEVYPTAEEAAMNPHDLNTYCALPFDIPFEKAHPYPEGERTAFVDDSAGEAVDWEAWRALEGLPLLLWVLKYVICDGIEVTYAYLVQWSAFVFQKRRKPCVMPVVYAPPGAVKSSIFGENQTGRGPYMRIFGEQAYKLNNIDSLTQKHNTAGNGKFYCVLEEASPCRKAHRAPDKLKDIIDSSSQRIEPKGVDDYEVRDCRAFVAMTNHKDAFPGEQGERRFLMLCANPHFSNFNVDSGLIDESTRDEFCAKFDALKNSNELAYDFFEYCMLLDLGNFKLHLPPQTEMLKEMQEHTKCALERFLKEVASREYGCDKEPYASYMFTLDFEHTAITDEEYAEKEEKRIRRKWADLKATDLYGKFKEWKSRTDAETSIESATAFGIAIKEYTIGDPKCTTKKFVSKRMGRSKTNLYTVELLDEDDGDNGDDEGAVAATAAAAVV